MDLRKETDTWPPRRRFNYARKRLQLDGRLRMVARRLLFGKRPARALLLAVVVAQGLPVVNVCALPAPAVSMSFAAADMPDPCAGLSKHACLMAYLQADQAPDSSQACIASFASVVVASAAPVAQILG